MSTVIRIGATGAGIRKGNNMGMIRVRTVAGRVARTAPRGQYIPTDKYIEVEQTPYINRLLHVHGDIELEPAASAPVAQAEPPKKPKGGE